jgi:site-specific recombinase XerD
VFTLIYKYPATARRHRAGPLADQRLRYLAHFSEQGAIQGTLQGIAQAMLVVIELLDLKAAGEVGADEIIAAANRWATREPRNHNTKHARKARLHFISVATQWLRFLGRLRLREASPHPYVRMVDEFVDYMKRERGLSPRTIESQCWLINDFLRRLSGQHIAFNELSVAHIDGIISRKGSEDGYSRRSIRGYAETLRAFLRYAERRGWCSPGLAAGVKAPRVYQDESLPAGPRWEDVQHLIASAENNRPTDIRDRAILMLLAVYGLRSAEVRCLKLEDLDWEKELVRITRPKQLKTQMYPLSHIVGEAIVRYLKEVRPRSLYRELFLTLQAPIQPLSRSGLWNVVSRRLQSLSPSIKHRGPHSLRHACASHLLAQGLSLKEIGDHLGHRSPNATRVYAKVDIAGLREVADFPLGGLL